MTANTPGPAEQAARRLEIARIVNDLAHDYADRFTQDRVGRVYTESSDRLAGPPGVATFLPVWAGRFAGGWTPTPPRCSTEWRSRRSGPWPCPTPRRWARRGTPSRS